MGAASFIKFTDAFFYDVVNQVAISDASNDTKHDVEVVYNNFKDVLQMDNDGRIFASREKMLTLEYFQMFMSIMYGMHIFYRHRMTEDDPDPEKISFSFGLVFEQFCRYSYLVRNYPTDESTWDKLESDRIPTNKAVDDLLCIIYDYCYGEDDGDDDGDFLPPPPSEIHIPPDDDETDDDEPGENLLTKLREQEIMQDTDLSRAHWAAEKIMLVVRTTTNICVLITLVFVIARMWALILSTEEKYKISDAELGSIILTLIIITIITNIKTIFGWIKELTHG